MLQGAVSGLSNWGSKVAEQYRIGDAILLNRDAFKAHTRYGVSHDPKDLDAAIVKGREAVRKMPTHYKDRCIILDNLSEFLVSRYKAAGNMRDLDEAVSHALELLAAPPREHAEYIRITSNAVLRLRSRCDAAGTVEGLDLAISKIEEAVLSVPHDYSHRGLLYHNWSALLSSRYLLTRDSEDLEKCISTARLVIDELTTSSHPNRIKFLISLASWLRERFDKDGALQDINDAIEAASEAVKLARPSHPELATWLNYLALYHSKRFDKAENLDDANKAILYAREAIGLTPLDDALNQAKRFSSLSLYYSDRFGWAGDTNDLQLGVLLSRKALILLPPDHSKRPTMLHNLTWCLRTRYSRLGDLEDLDEAIRKGQEAVDLARPAEVDDLQSFRSNLSLDVYARFRQNGASKDLEHAIQLVRETIEVKPNNFIQLNNLVRFLCDRWERHHEKKDIEEAIRVGQKACCTVASDSNTRYTIMGNLAVAFRHRFEYLQSIDDLEEAIRIYREIIHAPSRKLGPAHALNGLSLCLHLRYRKLSLEEDLESAVAAGSRALSLLPNDHPDRAVALLLLLQLRLARFYASGNQEQIDMAIKEGMEAVSMINAPCYVRVHAGYWAGGIALHAKRWVEGHQLLSEAIHLMPKLTPKLLTRDDQQFAILRLINIVSLAVSASIQAHRPAEESLELLEAGRGVMASLTISSRNDVSDLDRVNLGLRLEYEILREKVNTFARPAALGIDVLEHKEDSDKTSRTRKTPKLDFSREDDLRALVKLEDKIRQLPGLARFQLSPAAKDLMELATEGPIVSFNVTTYRSDVFIVTRKTVRVLQLPSLKCSDLEGNALKLLARGKITAGKPRTKALRNKQLHKTLQWMWDVGVGQVLEELGLLTTETPKRLARVWWLTSGLMGSLPLHAAGYHGKGSTRNALHHIVASYIPSFKALAYARERRLKAVAKSKQRGLVVTMPKTTGMKDLEVEQEARIVQETVGQLTLQAPLILEMPTREEVIKRLPESTIVHLACHGTSDPYNPSNGGLFLQDGSLTIHDLGPISLPHAQIAYLSACSTAENAALNLIEEGIQVATGFQLMGFPHVVGTLWEASNRAAIEVAQGFYHSLAAQMTENESLVDHEVVATALHNAVKVLLQKEGTEDAISWAPFIHIGA